MLRTLRIRNLAVMEDLHVEFGGGLNALTGETGAGKSILLDALGLALGDRADSSAVRSGAERAVVEAAFEIGASSEAVAALAERGLAAEDGALIVRREISADSGGRVFVNDSPCTLATLREVVAGLADVLGQNRHQGLRDRDEHRALLDGFAGLDADVAAVASACERVRQAGARLDELAQALRSREDRIERLRARIAEIDEVAPRPGERDELERERRLLIHAGRVRGGVERALEDLYDDDRAASARVADAVRALDALADVDATFGDRAGRLRAARLELDDVAESLREFLDDDDEFDAGRVDRVERRLAALERLCLRHGATEDEVLAAREAAAGELAGLEDLEGGLDCARRDLAEAEGDYAELATALGSARRATAKRIAPAVEAALADLAMPKARFRVTVEAAAGPTVAGRDGRPVALTSSGGDRVEFLFSANPGEPPRPLGKVASGGELSRVMLALHGVVGRGSADVLVFDEVDAGVGGATADAVGRRLARLARDRQVLCVTHLPQVAAHADHHYIVTKEVSAGRTRARVRAVEGGDRVDELARMLGGRKVTAASRRNAEELIEAADAERKGTTA